MPSIVAVFQSAHRWVVYRMTSSTSLWKSCGGVKKSFAQMVARTGAFGYQSNRMALLLVVVSTETMDLTRESESFRTTANVAESSSLRTRVRQTDETNRVQISTRRR